MLKYTKSYKNVKHYIRNVNWYRITLFRETVYNLLEIVQIKHDNVIFVSMFYQIQYKLLVIGITFNEHTHCVQWQGEVYLCLTTARNSTCTMYMFKVLLNENYNNLMCESRVRFDDGRGKIR